jgi:hypothetical protein
MLATSTTEALMKPKKAAIYPRVSTGEQTTENQRRELEAVAADKGWTIVAVYEDAGISGANGRDKRPGFDTMLKDAVRRISRRTRCTVPEPTPTSRPVLSMPMPALRCSLMAASLSAGSMGRPIGFPLLVPCSSARAIPALIRAWITARSNSANTPNIWNMALPAGVHAEG